MRALPIILLISQFVAIVTLVTRGLAKSFPALVAYLAASLVRGLALSQLPLYGAQYRDVWLVSLPLVTALQVAVAVEAYRRSLEELPGAQRLTHQCIVGLSVLAAVLIQIPQKTYTKLGGLSLAHQAVGTVLGVSAILFTILVTYLRPLRRRNAVVHERVLAVHLTTMSVLLALYHAGAGAWTGTANELISIGCCLAWLVLLQPSGEAMPARPAQAPADFGLPALRGRIFEILRSDR